MSFNSVVDFIVFNLLFHVLNNPLSIHFLLLVFTHTGMFYVLSFLWLHKQVKWTFNIAIHPWRQIFKEQCYRFCFLILITTPNNRHEFRKLNLTRLVIIDELNHVEYFLYVLRQAHANKGFFQLFPPNTARAIMVQWIKARSKFFNLSKITSNDFKRTYSSVKSSKWLFPVLTSHFLISWKC